MIIFDLDGTLADCEHRRHFIDRLKDHPDYYRKPCESCRDGSHHAIDPQYHKITQEIWKPDWQSFDESCDKDRPILPMIDMLQDLHRCEREVQIWSGRSELVREKTIKWLTDHAGIDFCSDFCVMEDLKMRPIGDNTPDYQLKERWLDDHIASMGNQIAHDIEFVFDSDPRSIDMWRRRDIFVFDVNQSGQEF